MFHRYNMKKIFNKEIHSSYELLAIIFSNICKNFNYRNLSNKVVQLNKDKIEGKFTFNMIEYVQGIQNK